MFLVNRNPLNRTSIAAPTLQTPSGMIPQVAIGIQNFRLPTDLPTVTPTPKYTIDLTTSSPILSDSDIVFVGSPCPIPIKKQPPNASPLLRTPPRSLKRKAEVLDLSLSSPIPFEDRYTRSETPPSLLFLLEDEAKLGGTLQTSRPSQDVRSAPTVIEPVVLGSVFATWEDTQAAIYAREEKLGHRWKIGQSKRGTDNTISKYTFRCNHYYFASPKHSPLIDPADFRKGKSIKTGCSAHVNINRTDHGLWHVTLVSWEHNHTCELPVGATAPRRPSAIDREIVDKFAASGTFTRAHMVDILKEARPGSIPLESRQISNLVNASRANARKEIEALGGDTAAIIESLAAKKNEDSRWEYHLLLDETQTIVGLWWQSPTQAELTRRFSDILINDNTYNRNQYGYPLNIGIGVDNFGSSRNLWYAFHKAEDIETHNWVFRHHLSSATQPPEVIISDRHPSLIASVRITMPLSSHLYCLHHLNGNVNKHLRLSLGPEWDNFNRDFWDLYRAVSPTVFELKWTRIIERFPNAASYLQQELYPCRERWAWAWISTVFTAGIRTNGHVEVENRVNKALGGPKKTLYQVFDALNTRTSTQSVQDMIRVREVGFLSVLVLSMLMPLIINQTSRRQHPTQVETLFSAPLELLRRHIGPFALQVAFKQMEDSVFYRTEVIQLPNKVREWVCGFLFYGFPILT